MHEGRLNAARISAEANIVEEDDQDRTHCSRLEDYKMVIKDNSVNFQSNVSRGTKMHDDEEKKFYSLPRNVIDQNMRQSTSPQMVKFASETTQNSANRQERAQLMKAL